MRKVKITGNTGSTYSNGIKIMFNKKEAILDEAIVGKEKFDAIVKDLEAREMPKYAVKSLEHTATGSAGHTEVSTSNTKTPEEIKVEKIAELEAMKIKDLRDMATGIVEGTAEEKDADGNITKEAVDGVDLGIEDIKKADAKVLAKAIADHILG